MIHAEVIKKSVSYPSLNVLTTFKVTFPRIILSEVLTHRTFSRNTSSSRAIPFEKMLEAVVSNPFIPYFWQKRHKGMQGKEYITDEVEIRKNITAWIHARDAAIKQAEILNSNGVTKQLANRLLEPFQWVTMIVSATELDNFFDLRCPKYRYEYYATAESLHISDAYFKSKKEYVKSAKINSDWYPKTEFEWLGVNEGQAEIHFQILAEKMYDAFYESDYETLTTGEWHIPYHDKSLDIITAIMVSTAKCARTSYTLIGEEKQFSVEDDLKLYDKLLEEGHMSPFEHCAMSMGNSDKYYNFNGFMQHRQFIEE